MALVDSPFEHQHKARCGIWVLKSGSETVHTNTQQGSRDTHCPLDPKHARPLHVRSSCKVSLCLSPTHRAFPQLFRRGEEVLGRARYAMQAVNYNKPDLHRQGMIVVSAGVIYQRRVARLALHQSQDSRRVFMLQIHHLLSRVPSLGGGLDGLSISVHVVVGRNR